MLAVALLLPSSVLASKVRPLSMPEIVEKAGRIFHGKVVKSYSGTDEETGMICTWTTVKIDSVLKGKIEDPEVTFKQLGGTDNKRGITDHFFRARFAPGQEVLLCLYPESPVGFSAPVGIQQGAFDVRVNPKTKEKHINNGMPAHVLFSDRPYPPQARMRDKMVPYGKETMKALALCKTMKLDDVKRGMSQMIDVQVKAAEEKQP